MVLRRRHRRADAAPRRTLHAPAPRGPSLRAARTDSVRIEGHDAVDWFECDRQRAFDEAGLVGFLHRAEEGGEGGKAEVALLDVGLEGGKARAVGEVEDGVGACDGDAMRRVPMAATSIRGGACERRVRRGGPESPLGVRVPPSTNAPRAPWCQWRHLCQGSTPSVGRERALRPGIRSL